MLSLLFVGFFSSCGGGITQSGNSFWEQCDVIAQWNVVNGDSVLSCDLSSVKKGFRLPMSYLFDTLEVVKLESRDDVIIGIGYPFISENYIVIREMMNAPNRLFTRKGEFVCNVGSRGHGPGEYNYYVRDIQIDEEHGRIYLLPQASFSILVYDFHGQFIESIPLSYKATKGTFYVDVGKQQVTIVNLVFEGDEDRTVAWVQDLEGNIIRENKAPQFPVLGSYSNSFSLHKRNGNEITFSFSYYIPKQDSLYTYDIGNNKLTPLFTVDFGEELVTAHRYETCSGYNIIALHGPNDEPETYRLCNILTTHRIIVDSKTLRGGYFQFVNDFLGGIHLEKPLKAWGYILNEDVGLSMCMESEELLGLINERLSENISEETRCFLLGWREDISEDDTNYVIFGKPKESL